MKLKEYLNKPTRKNVPNCSVEERGIYINEYYQDKKSASTGRYYTYYVYECCFAWVEYKRIDDGTVRRVVGRKTWGIRKWGKKRAVELAVKFRKQKDRYLESEKHLQLLKEYRNS